MRGKIKGDNRQNQTVIVSDSTLVITLHGCLSPAEHLLAQSPEGATQLQEFHRQLFANSSESLRKEIKSITGFEVREATSEVALASGTVVKLVTTGGSVQVFLLDGTLPDASWSGNVLTHRQTTMELERDGHIEKLTNPGALKL
jgi:uncharacterized protein YbcI